MVEGDISWFINCLVDMFVWERFGLFSCVLWDASATVCVWISRNGFRKVMDDNSLFHFKELQHNLAAAESVQREIEVMIQGSAGPLLSSSSSQSRCIDFWKIRYTLPFLKKLRCFWSLPPYHYTVICGWLDKCLHKSRETNSHLKNKPAGEKSLLLYHHDQIVHTSKPVESMRELGVSCTLTSAAAIFWFRSQLVVRTISSRSFFQKTHKSWLVLPEGTKKDLFQRWWICSGVHEGALEQLLLDNGGPSILFSAWP